MREQYRIEQTVMTLKKRIRDHGEYLREKEMRTRRSLIDPMLQALGWDAADPSLVMLEYSAAKAKLPAPGKARQLFDHDAPANDSKKVDYALMKPDGKPLAMIEAKRLKAKLNDSTKDQLFDYVDRSEVRYAGLTNGDRWALYLVTENMRGKPLDRRRVFHVSIMEDRLDECVKGLTALLRSRLLPNEELEPPTAMKNMRWF